MRSVAVDTEYAPNGDLLTVGVATPTHACAADLNGSAPYYDSITAAKWIMGHSVTGDIDHLVKLGIAKPEWVSGEHVLDSLLCARMVDENRGPGGYGLEVLLQSGHQVKGWKVDTTEFSETDATQWPPDLRVERCRLDAWASAVLCRELAPLVPSELRQFTHRIAQVINRIYHAGAYIDLPAFETMGADLHRHVVRTRDLLTRAAQQVGMVDFTPTNDNHLRELLYKRMNLTCDTKTKTGKFSVSKSTLKKYDADITKLVMEFNKYDKRHSTWYGSDDRKTDKKSLKELIQPTGQPDVGLLRIRINPLGARTGRRSSGGEDSFNSQNMPKEVRPIFRSRWQGGMIGDFDYSGLEMVLMGWIAPEPKLLDYFGAGGPGYVGIAKELFGHTVKKGTPDYVLTKAIVLGTGYGMGGFKLAAQFRELGVVLSADPQEHIKQAKTLQTTYLDKFPGIKRYMAERKRELIATGQVVSPTGRVRHLPCPDGDETEGFGHLVNEAINFPIQSLASDVTGSALIDVEAALCDVQGITLMQHHEALLNGETKLDTILINEVHDDLVFDMHEDVVDDRREYIEDTMKAVPTLRKLLPSFDLPLSVGVHIAPRWAEVEV